MLAALGHRLSTPAPLRCQQLPDTIEVGLQQAAGFECASLRILDITEAALILGFEDAACRELGLPIEPSFLVDTGDPWTVIASLLEPRLGVLTTARDNRDDWLRAGQALERIVLTGARHGLATSLLYRLIELHDLQDERSWWPWPEQPQMIIGFRAEPGTEVPRAEAARPCVVTPSRGDAQPS